MERIKAKVSTKNLAFWESLVDCGDEPTRYLKYGEVVTILGTVTAFGGIQGDKEYCKVEHPVYGLGYMRKEGLEAVN